MVATMKKNNVLFRTYPRELATQTQTVLEKDPPFPEVALTFPQRWNIFCPLLEDAVRLISHFIMGELITIKKIVTARHEMTVVVSQYTGQPGGDEYTFRWFHPQFNAGRGIKGDVAFVHNIESRLLVNISFNHERVIHFD